MTIIVLDNSVAFTKCWVLFKAVYIYFQVRQSEKPLSQRRQIMLSTPPTHTCFVGLDFKPEK